MTQNTFETLALGAINACEIAAIASFDFIGKMDEKAADGAAVKAMREGLNAMPINGRVVIGEGERDEAPMLYIGEEVGIRAQNNPAIDIALDPLEGTGLTAQNRVGAITVLAMAPRGALLHAPDVYMDKLAVGARAAGANLDLDAPIKDTLADIARASDKNVGELMVCVLDRDRHIDLISEIKAAGAKITLIQDGDIAAIIAAARDEIDVYIGSGGAPEGVLAAAALRCTGGKMLGRLTFRNDIERGRAAKTGVTDLDKIYTTAELASGENIIFAASGVTDGGLVHGARKQKDGGFCVQSLLLQLTPQTGSIKRLITTTGL